MSENYSIKEITVLYADGYRQRAVLGGAEVDCAMWSSEGGLMTAGTMDKQEFINALVEEIKQSE